MSHFFKQQRKKITWANFIRFIKTAKDAIIYHFIVQPWHLLQLEWKKFKYFRTFKVMAILYLVLLPLLMIVGKAFGTYIEIPPEAINLKALRRLPDIWPYLAYIGNWLSFFFLGFIGVLSVSTEFANKTLRQNIINGVTRNQFFLGKFLFIFTICLLATLYFAFVGFSFGLIYTKNLYLTKIIAGTEQIYYYFLMCFGYMFFGFFLGVLLRRTGLALFLYIVYILFLEPAIRWAIHSNIVFNQTLNYYPLNAIEDLSPIPIPKMVSEFSTENDFSLILTQPVAAIVTVFYLSLFIFIAYYRIKKSDL